MAVDWGPPGQTSWVTMEDGCDVLLRTWAPDGPAKCAVHICHGMGDHSWRYAGLALRLVAEGCVVSAADHRSHGQTGQRAEEEKVKGHRLGHMDLGGADLLQRVVEDNVVLCQRLPDVPLVVFGHSMGSLLARLLAAKRPKNLRALVLSGAPATLPLPLKTAFGPLLALLGRIYGEDGVAPLTSTLTFDKFNKQFAPNSTDWDWVNSDPAEVQQR
ncbi:unnamed protein product, partial [Effrenium voratum]